MQTKRRPPASMLSYLDPRQTLTLQVRKSRPRKSKCFSKVAQLVTSRNETELPVSLPMTWLWQQHCLKYVILKVSLPSRKASFKPLHKIGLPSWVLGQNRKSSPENDSLWEDCWVRFFFL